MAHDVQEGNLNSSKIGAKGLLKSYSQHSFFFFSVEVSSCCLMSQQAAKECAYGRNANETNEQFRSLHDQECRVFFIGRRHALHVD